MADKLFPASIIGSMPRPDFVKDLIADNRPQPRVQLLFEFLVFN